MSRPPIRDQIIPGSRHTETTVYVTELLTLRCARCGRYFEVRAECKTTRCRCGRVCRIDTAIEPGLNVVPFPRRGAA
jgi:hypothetical protein